MAEPADAREVDPRLDAEEHAGLDLDVVAPGDPAVVDCVDTIESGSDEIVDLALDPEVNNLSSALNACALARILELGLTAAGADLTNESFAAGLASLGDLSLAGFGSASLGPEG